MSFKTGFLQIEEVVVPSLEQQDSIDYEGDNGSVFVTTNESRQDISIRELSTKELSSSGDTFIGVSGLSALNLAAARAISQKNMKHIVMVDCSERVQNFWISMRTIITESHTAQEALSKIENLIDEKKFEYFPNACQCCGGPSTVAEEYKRDLREEVRTGISWLSDEKRFQKIKNIFKNNRFDFFKLNLCKPKTMTKLLQHMKGKKLDSIYLSNIKEYAQSRGFLHRFHECLSLLFSSVASRDALIIDTQTRSCSSCERLAQKVFKREIGEPIEMSFPGRPIGRCFPQQAQVSAEPTMPSLLYPFSFLPQKRPRTDAFPEFLPGNFGIKQKNFSSDSMEQGSWKPTPVLI